MKNEHVATMEACESWVVGGAPPVNLGYNRLSQDEYLRHADRAAWLEWSAEIDASARGVASEPMPKASEDEAAVLLSEAGEQT